MDVQLTWTDCDEAGDYVVPNVLSPRELVSRPDNMDKLYYTQMILLKGHLLRGSRILHERLFYMKSDNFTERLF